MSTDNSNNLSEFLSFETKQHQSSSSDDITIGRHALDQLLESKLGNEITWCAQQLATNNKHNNDNNSGNVSSSVLEEEVTKLMGTPAFQQINAQIRECPLSLLLPSNQTTSVNNRSEDDGSNKKSREESTAAANNNKPAATSFSLFDLMDSQKGAFVLPPRIMAQQVIDADQRHDNNIMTTNNSNDDTVQNYSSSSDNTADCTQQATNNNNNSKSALELLEQAEDMEDLSPDVDSWEQILSILYRGLINKTNVVERRRYFNVHMLIFDKCQKTNGGGGGMFRSQTWGLTFNIVGFILSLSNEFDKKEDEQVVITTDLDLYWDSCHHLVLSLSHLAMEYVTSSVGHEKEMERMSLGLCSILCTDVSSCVLAMMEPMAGWFEVWARFVGPSTLMSILRVSGLGEVVLRRCESRGRNESSKRLHEMIRQRDGSSSVTPTLEDLEESNFLQSLSILRVITSRCDATLGSMGSIFCCNATLSSFLSADGIVRSSDEVQAMLGTKEQCLSIAEQEEMRSRLLKPFRDVLLLRESTPALVDADLEELCTQTVSLIEQLC
eukprot:scaffold10678_cov130-Skeletonema_marinoi.AAC.12